MDLSKFVQRLPNTIRTRMGGAPGARISESILKVKEYDASYGLKLPGEIDFYIEYKSRDYIFRIGNEGQNQIWVRIEPRAGIVLNRGDIEECLDSAGDFGSGKNGVSNKILRRIVSKGKVFSDESEGSLVVRYFISQSATKDEKHLKYMEEAFWKNFRPVFAALAKK